MGTLLQLFLSFSPHLLGIPAVFAQALAIALYFFLHIDLLNALLLLYLPTLPLLFLSFWRVRKAL